MNPNPTEGQMSWASKEQRALTIAKWGNLFMGAAGVLAAWLSHSQALLVDGLFSLVGFTAAIFARQVSASIRLNPDMRRPLGYAADESIYTTFRALSLIGVVAFAFGSAVLNIVDYATGGDIAELEYGPIVIYFIVICIVCFGLATTHYFVWKSTGRQSDVLRLEMKSATFDGIITVAAGLGLSVMPLLKGTSVGWIAPIGDSLVVVVLCVLVIGHYFSDFRKGLGELAGVSISQKQVSGARVAAQGIFDGIGGDLVDLSVIKFGRMHQVQMYFEPSQPISAETVDHATRKCDQELAGVLGSSTSVILISCHGRVLGEPGSEVQISDRDQE